MRPTGIFCMFYEQLENKLKEEMMKNYSISENEDKALVQQIRDGLKATGGYCPCRIERIPETKCMCEEFSEQLNDPTYFGPCHCGLFIKKEEASHEK